MPADLDAGHFQRVGELRDISQTYLDEQDTLVGWQMVRFAGLTKFGRVLLDITEVRPVGDDADRSIGDTVDELARSLIRIDAVHPQLGRAKHTRRHRCDD